MSAPAVALLGFGRFGKALATLLQGAQRPFWVHDPNANVPEDLRAPSLDHALSAARLVIPAVPIPTLEEVLRDLRPRLSPAQLLLDVSSVKAGPEAALRRTLGRDIPWVATHPLFGPSSLDKPPLRVIVCPNEEHPQATAEARDFFASLGCVVGEMPGPAHDRLMSETQALAFFLGESLRAADLGGAEPFATPSAQALSVLAGAVTAEGGHVRDAILAQNPEAPRARRRFLRAAREQAARLDHAARASQEPSEQPSQALLRLREEIDALDQSLLQLLATRAEVARHISRAKAAMQRPVRDPAREAAAFQDRVAQGAALGLPSDFVTRVFEEILAWSRDLQEQERRASAPDESP